MIANIRWRRLAGLILWATARVLHAAAPPTEDAIPEVAFEQRIGARLPLASVWTDERGERHALGDYFASDRPVVLYFGYAGCTQLCAVVADGTVSALRRIRPEPGRDYEVVALSIDPRESAAAAAARKTDALRGYGEPRSAAAWHFLRADEGAIRAVAAAAGFRYVHDPRSGQYAHASGFLVATPDGVVSRYFLGVDFAPDEVARAIRRAASGEPGESVADLLLRCFHGDGISGRYGPLVWKCLGAGVTLTVCGLAGGVGWMLRQERRRRGEDGDAGRAARAEQGGDDA